jgi:hypothetical protein
VPLDVDTHDEIKRFVDGDLVLSNVDNPIVKINNRVDRIERLRPSLDELLNNRTANSGDKGRRHIGVT